MEKKRLTIILLLLIISTIIIFYAGCVHKPLLAELEAVKPEETENDAAAEDEYPEESIFIDFAGMTKLAGNISELEEYADVIVMATVIDMNTDSGLGGDECITLTDIQIDKIILNDGGLEEGDKVIVIEYYRIEPGEENEKANKIISTNATLPLIKSGMYLLFLKRAPKEQRYGDYAIAYGWQGKYPVNDATKNKKINEMTTDDLEWRKENEYAIGKEIEGKMVIPLAEQIIEKYLSKEP